MTRPKLLRYIYECNSESNCTWKPSLPVLTYMRHSVVMKWFTLLFALFITLIIVLADTG